MAQPDDFPDSMREEKHENHLAHHHSLTAGWGSANLALQCELGILPKWRARPDFAGFAHPGTDGDDLKLLQAASAKVAAERGDLVTEVPGTQIEK